MGNDQALFVLFLSIALVVATIHNIRKRRRNVQSIIDDWKRCGRVRSLEEIESESFGYMIEVLGFLFVSKSPEEQRFILDNFYVLISYKMTSERLVLLDQVTSYMIYPKPHWRKINAYAERHKTQMSQCRINPGEALF